MKQDFFFDIQSLQQFSKNVEANLKADNQKEFQQESTAGKQ